MLVLLLSMHVLFLIHSMSSGGAERATAMLANHWASKGWRVTVATIAGPNEDFYGLDPRIDRLPLGLDRQSEGVVDALLNNTARIKAVRRVLQRLGPDVAVGMMTTAACLLALAGWGLRGAFVGAERTYPPAMPVGKGWQWTRRLSYPRLDAVVAQTHKAAEWLRVHAAAKRVDVVANPVVYPMPVAEPRIDPGAVVPELGRRKVLLAVGRLSKEKRFDELIGAFAIAAASDPEWVLVILGEGPQRSDLQRKAVALGIEGRVHMPGAVGNVGEWYQVADLYALTSRFEGFPNTLLEALAHGVPSVAVDCDTGPRDILRHEVNGLLVPPDDQERFVSALDQLFRDEAMRARFGDNAKEARRRFSVESVTERWERLFKELMANK